MAPKPRIAKAPLALAWAGLVALAVASPAHALRVVNYNILNYPGTTVSVRNPHFRTIFAPLAPDIVIVQEMQSQAGVDSFRMNVLNVLDPGQWSSAPFINGPDTDNGLFYKPAKVQYLGQRYFYVSSDATRYVNEYRLRPVGYVASSAELKFYSAHLKALTGADNVAQRLREATGLRDTMNAQPAGMHLMVMGDFNIYSGAEGAFTRLLESQADNDGRLYDPLNAPLSGWQNTVSMAGIHTQSPCLTCVSGSYASGGLDDRFDMFLPTRNWNDGEGLDLLVATYKSVGNDGAHLNKNITDAPTIPEGAAYATALHGASDHLPIRVDFQVPAQIAAVSTLDLGTVIVSGAASLSVSNPALAPADELNYSFAAPAGFSVPAGPFTLTAGAPASQHGISTTGGSFGPRSGNLVVSTDDPDRSSLLVALTANVLDHASASLDSTSLMVATTVNLGTHDPGNFAPTPVPVYNLGYDALHARLQIETAAIAGGEGRFSIVSGTTPVLVEGSPAVFEVAFDDTGAIADSTYEANLTFAIEDETLPGATALPNLVVTLTARPLFINSSVDDPVPSTTRLLPAYPNPLRGVGMMAFELAHGGEARLEILDITGRLVTVLAARSFAPGRHALLWNGKTDGGLDTSPGLYFARLSGPEIRTQSVRFARVH